MYRKVDITCGAAGMLFRVIARSQAGSAVEWETQVTLHEDFDL